MFLPAQAEVPGQHLLDAQVPLPPPLAAAAGPADSMPRSRTKLPRTGKAGLPSGSLIGLIATPIAFNRPVHQSRKNSHPSSDYDITATGIHKLNVVRISEGRQAAGHPRGQ